MPKSPDYQFTPLSEPVLEALGAPFCVPHAPGETVDLRSAILLARVDEDTVFVAGLDRRGVFPQVVEGAVNDHAIGHVLAEVFSVKSETADAVRSVIDWCSDGMAFSFDRKHPRD